MALKERPLMSNIPNRKIASGCHLLKKKKRGRGWGIYNRFLQVVAEHVTIIWPVLF